MLLFKLLQIPEEIKLCLWFSWGGETNCIWSDLKALKWISHVCWSLQVWKWCWKVTIVQMVQEFKEATPYIWQTIMELGESSYLEKRSSFSSSISLSISSAIHHGVVSVKMFNLRPPYVLPSWICIWLNLLRCQRNKICPIKNLFCYFFTAIYADVENSEFSGM